MKKEFTALSFHPKFAAFAELFLGLIFVWWLASISVWWVMLLWVVFRLLTWGGLIFLSYYAPGSKRLDHFLLLVFFGLGMLGFLLFIDSSWSWQVAAAVFSVFPAVSFWLLPAQPAQLTFLLKPARRFRLLMTTFGIAGLWSGIGGLSSFNISSASLWLWLVVGVSIQTALAAWWWREYDTPWRERSLLSIIVFFIISLEFSWVVLVWPIGFLLSGILLSYIWYLLQLIFRFLLTKDGINWQKQAPVLATSAVILLLILVVVTRWR